MEDDKHPFDQTKVFPFMRHPNEYLKTDGTGFQRQPDTIAIDDGESQTFFFSFLTHQRKIHVSFFAWPSPIFIVSVKRITLSPHRYSNISVYRRGFSFFKALEKDNEFVFVSRILYPREKFTDLLKEAPETATIWDPLSHILDYLSEQLAILRSKLIEMHLTSESDLIQEESNDDLWAAQEKEQLQQSQQPRLVAMVQTATDLPQIATE
jgi:hypothetical protein